MVVDRHSIGKSGWIWIATVSLIVVMGGGWFLFRGPKGMRLKIESLPSGAKVFVNDLEVGPTPQNQSLVPGDKVRLELKGHLTHHLRVQAGRGSIRFQDGSHHQG